ncbi:hypothetical protein ACFLV0_04810 [Chloroflexota bacterium]
MVVAGILAIIISVATKSRGNQGKPRSFTPFVAIGMVLGLFAGYLFILPFLCNMGFACGRLDPAYYIGSFTMNPLMVVHNIYGTNLVFLAFRVSLTTALGFLAVLVVSTIIINAKLIRYGVVTGLIGGAVLVTLGLTYGFVFETTESSNIAIPVSILVLLGYILPTYIRAPIFSKLSTLEKAATEYLKSHNHEVSLTQAVADLGYEEFQPKKEGKMAELPTSFFHQPDEKPLAILGQGYISSIISQAEISRSMMVLTGRRVYVAGKTFQRIGGKVVSARGKQAVSVSNITGTGYMETNPIGLLIVGIIVSLWGLLGTIVGIVEVEFPAFMFVLFIGIALHFSL